MHGVVESLGQQTALVDHAAAGQRRAEEADVLHRVEIAEGVRVVQWAVLAKALDVIRSLHVVAERLGGVAAGEELAIAVEVDAPGIAAAFGKELEPLRS